MGFKYVWKGYSWAAVADMYNRIIIVVIVTGVGEDLEEIIVACHSLMYDWHPVEGAWCGDCV